MVGVKSDTFLFLILIYTKMYLRGFTDFVALNSCNDDVSSHLIDHHLSRESASERELILARAATDGEHDVVSCLSLYSGNVLAT